MLYEARILLIAALIGVGFFLFMAFLVPCEACRRRRERLRRALAERIGPLPPKD